MEDDELVMEARRGSRAALELLVARYQDEIYRYAARRCGSLDLAQDITQTTFEKMVRALPRYRLQGRFRQWLFIIASNAANDCYRSRLPAQPLPRELGSQGDVLRLLVQKEQYLLVRNAVQSLPDSQKETVILFYYHDMSLKQICEITGSNLNTVKSRLRLGVDKLRSQLEVNDDGKEQGKRRL